MIKEKFQELFDNSIPDTVYDYELAEFAKNVTMNLRTSIPSLFRYSPADYYNIRGLETQSLFLSPIGNMNDVFEGLSCEITDAVVNNIEDLCDIAFVKSFSENRSNLLMWAHYAQNYSGMCVEYNFNKLPEDFLFHLFPIYYSPNRLTSRFLEYVITEHIDLKKMNDENCYPNDRDFIKDIMSLFLMKSNEWIHEKEWRFLATYPQIYNSAEDLDDEQEVFYRINSQQISVANCIKGVYLGPKMKQSIKEHIIEICHTRLGNVSVYSTKLSKNKYELEHFLIP